MTDDVRSLAEAAKRLTPEQQDELIDILLLNADGDDALADDAWAKAWGAEAERRFAEVVSGSSQTFDAAEVLSEGRRALASRRSKP